MKALPWHREALRGLAADRSRMAHALLVTGRAGIGKGEFARALAAAVLCESPAAGEACGACPSCHWLSQGNHPDFREVLPEASEDDEEADAEAATPAKADKKKSLVIKIEQIRAQADFMALTTHRSGYRVLVIRPAESLHANAANALLKTLEEPPASTLIVLVSSQPSRVLATIRSRCRLFSLPTPRRDAALAWLRAEGVEAPETALACAGGAPLLARDLARAEELQLRRKVVTELARPEGADAVAFATGLDRAALERTVYWMQTWVADLVRLRAGVGIRHHIDMASALAAKAKGARADGLFELDRELRGARRLAAHPLNPRLMAEHLMMAYNRATSGPKR